MNIFERFFSAGKKGGLSSERRHVKDVKPDEYISIEWYMFQEGIGKVRCINNDPQTKKIWLEINWKNKSKEQLILNYDDSKLANFHLLNQLHIKKIDNEEKEKENFIDDKDPFL